MDESRKPRIGPIYFITDKFWPYVCEHPIIVGILVADAIGFLLAFRFFCYLVGTR